MSRAHDTSKPASCASAGVLRFGHHVYAVGGKPEAARRAGINVARTRILVFVISGVMAALGGIIFSARLSSVDLNAGGGTILLDDRERNRSPRL